MGTEISSFAVVEYQLGAIPITKILDNLFSTPIELLVIKQALDDALSNRYTKFLIFSDSRPALLPMKKKAPANQNVCGIYDILNNPFNAILSRFLIIVVCVLTEKLISVHMKLNLMVKLHLRNTRRRKLYV